MLLIKISPHVVVGNTEIRVTATMHLRAKYAKIREMTHKKEDVHPLGALEWSQIDKFVIFC